MIFHDVMFVKSYDMIWYNIFEHIAQHFVFMVQKKYPVDRQTLWKNQLLRARHRGQSAKCENAGL